MHDQPRIDHYNFHGLHLTITGDDAILGVLRTRLRHFSSQPQTRVDIAFEFRHVSSQNVRDIEIPQQARPVYESQRGLVSYDDSTERLFISYGDTVRAICEPDMGLVQVSIAESEAHNVWLISHPMFTLPFIECVKRQGLYNVHAAGVSVDGKAFLLPGASGSGKSTLSLILTRAGFTFLSDDMLFLTHTEGSLRLLAFPDEIDVTDHTIDLLPELRKLAAKPKMAGWPKRQFLVEDMYDTRFLADSQPAILMFPQVVDAEQSTIRPIDPGEALLNLAPNVLLTSAQASQNHLTTLRELTRICKCYRLDVGRDFEAIPILLRGILG